MKTALVVLAALFLAACGGPEFDSCQAVCAVNPGALHKTQAMCRDSQGRTYAFTCYAQPASLTQEEPWKGEP